MSLEPRNLREKIAAAVMDSALKVHRELGPGLPQSVYVSCFCFELGRHGLSYQRQASVPIRYDGMLIDGALILDVLVEGEVICDIQSVEALQPAHETRLQSYLRLTGKPLGFLVNFNVNALRDGIRRLVL